MIEIKLNVVTGSPEHHKLIAFLHDNLYEFSSTPNGSKPIVSGALPPDELEKSLGSTSRQFTIWHDGGEWLISLKGKEQEQCKTLREWLGGNDR